MLVTLSDIVMLVSPVQSTNAYLPMLVTLSPIVTLVILETPLNKYAGIFGRFYWKFSCGIGRKI